MISWLWWDRGEGSRSSAWNWVSTYRQCSSTLHQPSEHSMRPIASIHFSRLRLLTANRRDEKSYVMRARRGPSFGFPSIWIISATTSRHWVSLFCFRWSFISFSRLRKARKKRNEMWYEDVVHVKFYELRSQLQKKSDNKAKEMKRRSNGETFTRRFL
jgi:hypothetical protein